MTGLRRDQAVGELKELWRVLKDDLRLAQDHANSDKTPYAYRALVRAFFALVEGLLFAMRQVALGSSMGTDLLSPEDRDRLSERRHYLQFPDSLIFSIECYAKIHGASFTPDRSNEGWRAFDKTVKVRGQITHPKSASSLSLTGSELDQLLQAAAWWRTTLIAMFNACDEADAYWRSQLAQS